MCTAFNSQNLTRFPNLNLLMVFLCLGFFVASKNYVVLQSDLNSALKDNFVV